MKFETRIIRGKLRHAFPMHTFSVVYRRFRIKSNKRHDVLKLYTDLDLNKTKEYLLTCTEEIKICLPNEKYTLDLNSNSTIDNKPTSIKLILLDTLEQAE